MKYRRLIGLADVRLISLLACLVGSAGVHAATFTWDGSTSFSWDTVSENWTTPGVFWPGTGTDNDAVFGGTGVGTILVDAGGIVANDLTFNTAGYTIDGPGVLTLNGATNVITAAQAATMNAGLAGSNGFTKAGVQRLTLSGDNSGLSGILTIDEVAGTNNNGVWISSAGALGGITTVNVGGTATTGGHFRLQGTGGITLSSSVSINLFGQGGNSAPTGTLVGGGTGINTVAGGVTINTNGVRISNSGATRLDITGAITQPYASSPTDQILFRFGDNEGIRLTNTSNSWSVRTVISQGTLWAEPGALPATTNLQVAASSDGIFQTSGTFDRAVGNAANEVQWAYIQNGSRAGGLSARGGDLTVNLGGGGGDLSFNNFANPNGTRTLNSNTITAINTSNLAVGMVVSGTGIPSNTTITVIGSNTITLSANATAAGTSALTISQNSPNRITMNTLILNGAQADSKLTLVNPLDLNGFGRTVRVDANVTELAGGLKNTGTGNAVMTKTNGGTLLITGGISGAVGLTTNGGTTEISGTGVNTFTGGVSVNGGNLLIKRSDGLGTTAGGTSVGGGTNQGSLQFDAAAGDLSLGDAITLSMRASVVANSSSPMKPNIQNLAGNTTLSGLINGVTGGAVTKIASDGGLLELSGEYRQSGASPTVSTRIGHLQGSGNGLISGTITQATGITHRMDKMGSGTWTLSGSANTFSGGVRVLQGVLALPSFGNGGLAGGLGAAASAADSIHLNGGTLRYTGAGESSDRLFTIGPVGGVLDASGSGALNLTNAGALVTSNGGGADIQFSFASGATTIATNDTSRLAIGMELSGLAGFAAGTKVTAIDHEAGLLTIDLPTTAASAVTVGTAAGVFDRTLSLTGSNTGDNTLGASMSDSANGGKLSVSKQGSGTWVLTGNHTYSGDTLVSSGTLYINGALANSQVMVTGGKLGGSSPNLGGGVTVASGAVLAPGNSIGTLTASAVSLGGTLEVEYGTALIDLVQVAGLLDLNGSAVSFVDLAGALDGTSNYVFATYGSLSGVFGSGAAPSGYQIDYGFGGNSIALVPIPEPAAILLGAISSLTLLRRRRRS
jgi:fibronectin-binding autotransporter adhesin